MSDKIGKGDEAFVKLLQSLSKEIENYAQTFFSLKDYLDKSVIRFDAVVHPTSENKLKAISLPQMNIISGNIKDTIIGAKSKAQSIIKILKQLERVIENSKIECPNCEGKGEKLIKTYHRDEDMVQPYVTTEKCPNCEGTGYLEMSKIVIQLTIQLMNGLQELKR
ncbi:MAG: hypothetical protein QXP32_05905 [Nitrososphaeria archaeon]